MTLVTQLRWLRQERRTRQRILTERHRSGFSAETQADARADLAVLAALLETLEGRQATLWEEAP